MTMGAIMEHACVHKYILHVCIILCVSTLRTVSSLEFFTQKYSFGRNEAFYLSTLHITKKNGYHYQPARTEIFLKWHNTTKKRAAMAHEFFLLLLKKCCLVQTLPVLRRRGRKKCVGTGIVISIIFHLEWANLHGPLLIHLVSNKNFWSRIG